MVYRTTINASALSTSPILSRWTHKSARRARTENLLKIRARKKSREKVSCTKGNKQRPSEFSSVRTEPSHRWMKSLLKDYKQALEGIDGG